MNTAALPNQATFFDTDVESISKPAKKQTRRFVPASPVAKLRFVPGATSRETLRFVPRPGKASRAHAPAEPSSMMRYGALGIAAVALVGSIFVTSSAPASARLAPAPAREPQADVQFAAELPAPVVTPVVTEVQAPRAGSMRARATRATVSVRSAPSRGDEAIDDLDAPTVVVPVDGPRPNPF